MVTKGIPWDDLPTEKALGVKPLDPIPVAAPAPAPSVEITSERNLANEGI